MGVGDDLDHLDPGERAAIALAEERGAHFLLMDERAGVIVARTRGLVTTGTLGVLDRAAAMGLVNLREAFERLAATTFRSPRKLMANMIVDYENRNRT